MKVISDGFKYLCNEMNIEELVGGIPPKAGWVIFYLTLSLA